jgi:hypothetical protein
MQYCTQPRPSRNLATLYRMVARIKRRNRAAFGGYYLKPLGVIVVYVGSRVVLIDKQGNARWQSEAGHLSATS